MKKTICPHCEAEIGKLILMNENKAKSFRLSNRYMFCPSCNKEVKETSKIIRNIEISFIALSLIALLLIGSQKAIIIIIILSQVLLFIVINHRKLSKGTKVYDPASKSYN